MSDIQKILIGIADMLQGDFLHASDLLLVAATLNGIPECYHKEAVTAAFSTYAKAAKKAMEEEENAE